MSDKNFKVKNGIDAAGKLTITNTSNTDSLIEVNGAGGGQFVVTAYGGIITNAGLSSIGGGSTFGGYGGTGSVVVNVRGASGQTGDLQTWTTFGGTILAKVDSTGSISATDLTLSGNLTVNGTTTNLNSTNLVIEDKNIIIADVATPTDTTADGAGITVKGATDKTFSWSNSTKSFISSEPLIINSAYSTTVGLIVQAATGQTSTNIFEVQRAGGGDPSFTVSHNYINLNRNTTAAASLTVYGANSGAVPLYVIGRSSQSVDLQQWQNSTGTVLTKIDNNAGFYAQYIEAKNTAGILSSGESQIKIASPDGLKDIRFWNRNDAGGLYYYNSSGGSKNILRIAHSTDPRVVTQTWQDFTSGNSANYGGRVNIDTSTTTAIGMVIRGAASQTADLQQWQNSAGTVLSEIDASGNITAPSYNLSDSKYLLRKTIKKTVDPAGNAIANNTYDLFDMDFPLSLQGTFYIQASIRGPGYGQNLTYSLPATYLMDWINQYPITNPFTNSTTWVDLTPLTFSPRHLMTNDYFKFQAKVNANQISFRIKLTGTLTGAPVFDIYIQHSEEFANSTITELNTTGTDATTSNVMPNSLSSKAGLSAIFNPITLYSNSASNTPLTIKGFASQTADILQIQDSSGTTRVSFERGGALSVQPSTALNGYAGFFKSPSSVVVGLMVRGASSQTANLQEWQDSAGTAYTYIGSPITTGQGPSIPLVFSSSGVGQIKWGNNTVWSIGLISGQTNVMYPYSYDRVALIVKGVSSQTGDLQQWRQSNDTVGTKIGSYGELIGSNLLANSIGPTISGVMWGVTAGLSSYVPVVIRGAASQTANLQEWQNSSGTVLANVDSAGNFKAASIATGRYIADLTSTTPYLDFSSNKLLVNSRNASYVGFIVQGSASQTANLQEWQNSSGTVENAIIPGKGLLFNLGNDGNGSQNLTQIAFGYSPISSSTGNWKHWVITKHNNAATVNNAIEFYTNDGTQSGVYPTNAIFGLSVTNGGIITPKENINIASASTVGLTVKGASSQTSDLQQWQNSSGTVLAKVDANGNFSAISKSFDIPHPTKENMRLRYASIEGPENGVYIRGTAESNIIELPEYWTGLVHEDSITVSLTAVGSAQNIYVEKIENNKVYIGGELTKAFFTVYGERKDIDKLTVEY